MKLSGWIFMVISWTMILGLAIFCFTRIFRKGLGGEDSEKTLKRLKKQKEIFKMTGNIAQDWPVYVLLGAVAFFFIYVVVKSNLQNKRDKPDENKGDISR